VIPVLTERRGREGGKKGEGREEGEREGGTLNHTILKQTCE
jgi:hypothetical protein